MYNFLKPKRYGKDICTDQNIEVADTAHQYYFDFDDDCELSDELQ
jgi:hypothetical protein